MAMTSHLSSANFKNHSHSISLRVYYDDTDAGGVVYHANYLKFAERARTEALRELGISQSELRAKEGVLFVVRRAEVDIKKAARLDDEINIESSLRDIGKVRMTMHQRIAVQNMLCAEVTTEIA